MRLLLQIPSTIGTDTKMKRQNLPSVAAAAIIWLVCFTLFVGPVDSLSASPPSTARPSAVSFRSPLLCDGYPPAVAEYPSAKPLLLYLPGFDGTLVAPFLQFPELGTVFDVRGMLVEMSDRSTFAELVEGVLEYLEKEIRGREVYLAGESFGGILACAVASSMEADPLRSDPAGLILINPATSYPRSVLAEKGPAVASLPQPLYLFGVASLLPLFADEYQLPQLIQIISSAGLPGVVDTPQREAYMGRVALSLTSRLRFMPRGTLRWRLEEWLRVGSEEAVTDAALSVLRAPALIVAGEADATLPSAEEAARLAGLMGADVHLVDGAGHAATCGSRVRVY